MSTGVIDNYNADAGLGDTRLRATSVVSGGTIVVCTASLVDDTRTTIGAHESNELLQQTREDYVVFQL